MSKIKINKVRLLYPNLFKTEIYNGVDTEKYSGTFLIDKKDVAIKKQIDAAIALILAENKIKSLTPDKVCIKDGDDSEHESSQGMWSIKAANKKRPTVINRDKTPVTADDNKFYMGCYVNIVIDLWFQDNKFGKRINANLYGVQFNCDGEEIGSSNNVLEDFDDLDGEL